MNDSQDSRKYAFAGKKILPIKTVEQLAASYLVAEVIVEIRKELENNLEQKAIDSIPKLRANASEKINLLYIEASRILKYKPQLIYMLKFMLEDMINYSFKSDPSVISAAANDTSHLNAIFGSSFSTLAKIDLETHTLNVFEYAVNQAKTKGRVSGVALPLIGALLHDFGKSTGIRNELLGEASARGYKAHAEVSAAYIQDILSKKLYNQFQEVPSDTLDVLSHLVKNHHPASKQHKDDQGIKFIEEADKAARKKEYKQLQTGVI